MTRRLLAAATFLLFIALPSPGQTPTLVQHVGPGAGTNLTVLGAAANDTVTDYIMRFPNPGGAGNAILVGVTHDDGSAATESVSDDQSNTYTLVKRTHDTTKGQFGSVFEAHNITGGVLQVKVSFSVGTIAVLGTMDEFRNVATSSPVDVSSGNFGASTSMTAGSMAPGTSGDLLWQVAFTDSTASLPLTSFTVGSQSNITWQFLGTEKMWGTGVQYGVYNSTSAINPTYTIAATGGGNANFISIAVALKPASAGTAPGGGIRVFEVQHFNTRNETAASVAFFWPTGALGNTNLLVIEFISGGTYKISSISDTASNTWMQAGSTITNNSNVQIFYAANPSASSLLTVTCTMSGSFSTGHGATFMGFEISGAAASPLDATASATGNDTTGSPITGATLTPNTSNGLVVSVIGIAFDSVTGITTTGSNFVSFRSTNEKEPEWNDENNGWAVHYNSGLSAIQDTWTHDTVDQTGAGNWAELMAAFKGGATVPGVNKRLKLEQYDNGMAIAAGGGVQVSANVVGLVMGPCDPADATCTESLKEPNVAKDLKMDGRISQEKQGSNRRKLPPNGPES